jgi:dTDP-4-amino-4,6-dideoxygalactose transaminase
MKNSSIRTKARNRAGQSRQSDGIAVLGAVPAFDDPIAVGYPNLGSRSKFNRHVAEILRTKRYTNNGPLVQEFEMRVADFIGARHCIATCNATVALEIAIRALNFSGEVILPSFTFVATAHALEWQRIKPVFCDIDPFSHNINPEEIENLITPRTSAIIGVHLWGRCCDVEIIEQIAERRGLAVIYDAAHAFGCTYNGKRIGNFGKCEVFSFHATKFINSFEGGAIVTNDDTLAAKLRLMRNFGFSGYDCVEYVGVNGKMAEICAAMGLTSLDAMEEIIDLNVGNLAVYRNELEHLPGVSILEYPENEKNHCQYVVLNIDPQISPLSRDELIIVLHAENVIARKYFWPGCHRMEPYRSRTEEARAILTNTERVSDCVIVLPNGQGVNRSDIQIICRILKSALQRAGDIKKAIEARVPE